MKKELGSFQGSREQFIMSGKKGIKAAVSPVSMLLSAHRHDAETGSNPYRVLRGPNAGAVFFSRNLDQSYALGYEQHVSEAISSLLVPGSVFYDIGANEGWFSVLATRKMNKSGKIYAFEPDSTNAAVLNKNLTINRAQNAQIILQGVGEQTETLQFASYENCGLVNHVVTPELQPESDAHISEIQVTSIDDFVAKGNTPPTLLKIDVEGLEGQVLKGAVNTFRSFRPSVISEVRTHLWKDAQSLMASLGYSASNLGGNARGFEEAGLSDVLFTPLDTAK